MFGIYVYQLDANLLNLYIAGERCTKLIADDLGDWFTPLVGMEPSPFVEFNIFPEFLGTNAITVFPLFKSTSFMLFPLFPVTFLSMFSCDDILSTLIF